MADVTLKWLKLLISYDKSLINYYYILLFIIIIKKYYCCCCYCYYNKMIKL